MLQIKCFLFYIFQPDLNIVHDQQIMCDFVGFTLLSIRELVLHLVGIMYASNGQWSLNLILLNK